MKVTEVTTAAPRIKRTKMYFLCTKVLIEYREPMY
jgi:hypothetical protein